MTMTCEDLLDENGAFTEEGVKRFFLDNFCKGGFLKLKGPEKAELCITLADDLFAALSGSAEAHKKMLIKSEKSNKQLLNSGIRVAYERGCRDVEEDYDTAMGKALHKQAQRKRLLSDYETEKRKRNQNVKS